MIKNLYQAGKTIFSIEVFPPKKDTHIESLYHTLDEFKELNPSFISVTYGAGGSTSRSTIEIASYIKKECGLEALAHLTCASLSNEEALVQFMNNLKEKNIENILALRGDKPHELSLEQFEKRHYCYASDLTLAIKKTHDFCIAGACYPEKHPESKTLSEDISNLKRKVDSGVDFLITQLFYDNDNFNRYIEILRNAGIHIPISAGLMPITSLSQVKNIIALSGTTLPDDLKVILNKYENSPDDLKKAGLDYTKKQMEHLLTGGVDGIHLYSMNKVDIATAILG